jgi:hypothetical protein
MNKLNSNTNSNLHQDSEHPLVYIRAFIEDDDRGYGIFDLVTSLKLVKKMAKSCKESMALDDTYVKKTYEEVLLNRFRPKTNIDEFCMSVIKYICNYLKEDIKKLTTKRNQIVAHIHVEDDDWSGMAIMPLDYVEKFREIDARNDYVGNQDIMISFDSKFEFLNQDEIAILACFVKNALSNPDHICKLTGSDLFDLCYKVNGKDTGVDFDNFIASTIKRLLSYRFIDINHEGDDGKSKHFWLITICDLEITDLFFDEFFRMCA